ncbi:MAG: UDP-N-acetylmuramoyl-L-alanine--D-glutamate ligase [Lachnospiraceae bacterium]|uniref:UDP-N-acetylmuramoyl-L-alanine--D-glutamate ligase n=1 Tax=Roseburia sp. 1XD42-69 TaxID=2320088 RepID=UPI000EA29277|nr:UDP-N-acetylmuramoyl-L-alanine--D-glutamate ligase [Roseburia sp. 1XD42-69]MCI8875244.1 UDP-N-acetylmuramoyl-L-alanine--D-glutamate ligase [Lachnospiraceae bacterium]MCX4319847.1 UDP-N-acetylmuramoyl-L-alanine--D-glutamate ligase [Lachnospiraceae bacterium]RKJ68243.1 UDP-N-acetylmuramoyl-L-alanine--D-glutamate ligase [Roseburia sp. 1XD42-69]
MNRKEKRYLVAGTGKSGAAAAGLLKKQQMDVTLYDGNENLDIQGFYEKHPELNDVKILLGELSAEEMKGFDILVLSPGIPTDIPMVENMRNLGITVWGEVELAYAFSKGKVLAVTGTNGKTTTTSLLGEIMKSSFSDVKVVGNIGIPYTSVALDTREDTVTVAEISSFQLETIENFAPKVTAILNITPDHLNRHHTMENYTAVKESITKNQGRDGICVLNYEDEVLRKFGESLPLKVIYFSSRRELEEGLFYKDDCIYLAQEGKVTKILPVKELNLLGRHNYENVMAAAAMALGFGVDLEKIRKVLCNFQAVEHRIEYVTEKRGVKFYNDSKGTNPDAAIQGIRAMVRPTFLIGGGYDKQSAYGEWIDAFEGKVKELVLIGQTREAIAETARKHGFTNIILKDTLEEAVKLCYEHAKSGDAVLLSPACASWGMFTDYEERGRVFKEIVNSLKE